MNKHFASRVAFALGIALLSIVLTTGVAAQDKDTCAGVGWEPAYIDDVDLVGSWIASNNRDCRESEKWQYTASITIEKRGRSYVAHMFSEDPTDFVVSGSQVRWTRDVTKSGADKNKVNMQSWTGTLQRNRRTGSIRIYGTWTGAYNYLRASDFNADFMITIK